MIDVAGNRSWTDCKRVLTDHGHMVIVGGPKTNRWIGPMGDRLRVSLVSRLGNRRAHLFLARTNREDMVVLQELLASGKVKPFVERCYGLSDVPEALGYLSEGHAQGKVVITV